MRKILTGLAAIVLAAGAAAAGQDHPVPLTSDGPGGSRSYVVQRVNGHYRELATTKDFNDRTRGDEPGFWPMTPEGNKKMVYYILDMSDKDYPYTNQNVKDLVTHIAEHYAEESHGLMTMTFTYGGHYRLPYTNSVEYANGDEEDWAAYADGQLGEQALQQYDGRVYFIPDSGVSGWAGLATTQGNTNLPNHDGYASQAWVAGDGEFLLTHELGHNFALAHAQIPPSPDNPEGDVYGDGSSVMGWADCVLHPYPECEEEMRGFNGEELQKLGWLAEKDVIIRSGTYRVSASELEHPQYPQLLQIVVPSMDSQSMYIDYRAGTSKTPDGTVLELDPEFAYGASIRRANTRDIWATFHFGTLQTGETWTTPDYYPMYGFFTVTQLDKKPDHVTVYVDFTTQTDTESWLTPGSCSDGINNDHDTTCDYAGCDGLPPEPACVFPWTGMTRTGSMQVGSETLVTCMSDEYGIAGYGPVGDGVGPITADGHDYTAMFRPTRCGTTTVSCGTTLEGQLTTHMATDVDVTCPSGGACVDGACVPPPRRARALARSVPR